MAAPPQETRQVLIPEHIRRSSSRIPEPDCQGAQRWKQERYQDQEIQKEKQAPKHSAFACMKDEDPRSIDLARQFDVEQRLEYIKSLKIYI
jgi:hypothetical protein